MMKCYTKLLFVNSMSELAECCTEILRGDNILTIEEIVDFLMEQENVESWIIDVLEDVYASSGSVLLRDAKIGDPDGFMQISNIMGTLHYDNGKPLSCDEYDYFEHYDRDQDFWGFYADEVIYDFITDGKELYVRVDMSFEELKDYLTDAYDGADYYHDFRE